MLFKKRRVVGLVVFADYLVFLVLVNAFRGIFVYLIIYLLINL